MKNNDKTSAASGGVAAAVRAILYLFARLFGKR